MKLERDFYARPTTQVARDLIGATLRRRKGARTVSARIVEVEAYLGPKDAASHARYGPTPRAGIMFGPPGRAYVYLIYGMHHCLNVVCEPDGIAGAVLIRALEPLDEGRDVPAAALCGPGRLCSALAITRADNGEDLCGDRLWIERPHGPPARVATTARIGVEYAGAWARRRLRFVDTASASLSRPLRPRARTPRGSAV